MRKSLGTLFLGSMLAVGSAWAGHLTEKGYTADRFGHLEVAPPAGKWEIRDREANGNNEYGGPVVDFLYKQPVGGVYPVVQVSAVKKAEADVTPEFVLQTSRDAILQQGGQLTLVSPWRVAGRAGWTYDAALTIKGQLSQVHYVLLEGAGAYFLAQIVVPAGTLGQVKPDLDALLAAFRY